MGQAKLKKMRLDYIRKKPHKFVGTGVDIDRWHCYTELYPEGETFQIIGTAGNESLIKHLVIK